MKPASKSAVSDVWKIPELEQYFHHNGLRIVLSTYAMQAVTSRWLGYATLHDNEPMLVDEVATHVEEIDWKKINGFDEMCQVADYLGKATGYSFLCFLKSSLMKNLTFSVLLRFLII